MTLKDSTNYSKGKLAVGYGVIVLLIGAIISLYISEWRQLEKLEQEVKRINVLRQKVHDAYAKKLELAKHGETILEWEATDTIRYRTKRLQLDSLLCEFKQDYPPHRLDTVLLATLAYNVGAYRLLGYGDRPKSRLIQMLDEGDRNIYREYITFRKYKGKVIPSLELRRRMEFELLYIP